MKYNIQSILESALNPDEQKYLFFWGHQPSKNGDITKSCMSQWWPSIFVEDGYTYHTAEHYMMAQKAKLFNDLEIMELIIANNNPKQVKSLGRRVKNFNQELWDSSKYDIVVQGNLLKFQQNIEFKEYLLTTGTHIIVEASPVDKIWGVGMAESDMNINFPKKWKGENLLGFALMEVRDQLTK